MNPPAGRWGAAGRKLAPWRHRDATRGRNERHLETAAGVVAPPTRGVTASAGTGLLSYVSAPRAVAGTGGRC
jgi:hypothetical protein